MSELELVPLDEGQIPLVEPWFDDEDTRRELGNQEWVRRAVSLVNTQPGSVEGDRLVTDRIVWVAFDSGVPVGLIDVETYEDSTASFAVVVAPSLRRQGIGRRIIRTAVQHRQFAAVSTWVAGVEPTNEQSIRCLEGAGFTLTSAPPDEQGMLTYEWRPHPERVISARNAPNPEGS